MSAKRKPSKTVEPHHKVQAEILTGEEGGKEKRQRHDRGLNYKPI